MITVIAVIVIVIAILGLVIYHDTHNFVVRNYEVETDRLKGDKTFVFLTDMHGYTFGRNNEKLIKAVDDIAPDCILCAGDMFTGEKVKGRVQTEGAEHLLKELSGRYPVYISNGNHEEKVKLYTKEYGNTFDRYKSSLIREGIFYLENESAYYDDGNVRITGLELSLDYFQKLRKKKMEPELLEKKLGRIGADEASRFQILIAHNPIYFDEYAKWGADLTVSGHVHGGIIRLPLIGGVISPAIALFPRYDGGKYEKDGKTMILGRGLGTHTIHVRMFNPGEVAVIKVIGRK
ncbi:MAG: metallophosphoesterase [Butyrivibrio sp.]|nr:metallophosphoesterase [Butyrivibrio sp.]